MTIRATVTATGQVVGFKDAAVTIPITSSVTAVPQGGTKTGAVTIGITASVSASGATNNKTGSVTIPITSSVTATGSNTTKSRSVSIAITSNVTASGQIVGNTAPVVTLTEPMNGDIFAQAESIPFVGSAFDAQQGALTGSRLVWTSSIMGQIGTGESFSRSDMTLGSHTITLTATDNGGLTDVESVSILVTATQPSFTTSGSAKGKKTIIFWKHSKTRWGR